MNSEDRGGTTSAERHNCRGFVLILFAAISIICTAIVGLSFDLGRMFIVKAELQAYADSAAIFAATKLDGTRGGIERANEAATTGPLGSTLPNKVNLASQTITGARVTYATTFDGMYDSYSTAQSNATNSYRFVRVTAASPTRLYFLPILNVFANAATSIAYSTELTASATGGQRALSTVTNGGLVPFAPAAHDPSETRHFGFSVGLQYTLKWGSGNTTSCAGDAGFNADNLPSEYGFVDVGQGNSNNGTSDAIRYSLYPNAYSNPSSISVGTDLYVVPGNRGSSIFDALRDRSSQDPDQNSTTYAQYVASGSGNGRRVVTAAIIDPATATGNGQNQRSEVIGFGNFLIAPASTISGSSGPICATYIGPASRSGTAGGASDGTKIYEVQLFQ